MEQLQVRKELIENLSNMSEVQFREPLKSFEDIARKFINELKSTGNGEAIAQATLAMRHLEDARMRYGKVIQHLGDGVSCYDKSQTPTTTPNH